jgi:hypothetical protein
MVAMLVSLLRGWCVVYVGDASVSTSWLVCCLYWRCMCLFFVVFVLSMLEMQVSLLRG